MVDINRTALLPYPAEQMFDLVNDVAAYPEYMEGCSGSEIIEQSGSHMVARLSLAKGPLKHSFVTRNTLVQGQSIDMGLVEGPFKRFEGHWKFIALDNNACKVSLDLRFDMSSKLLGGAAKKLFSGLGNSLVDSLCQRAHQLYGKQSDEN